MHKMCSQSISAVGQYNGRRDWLEHSIICDAVDAESSMEEYELLLFHHVQGVCPGTLKMSVVCPDHGPLCYSHIKHSSSFSSM